MGRGHRTLTITRKGGKVATIPLAPRTARAVDLCVGERDERPIFLNRDGTRRLDRHAATRIVIRAVLLGVRLAPPVPVVRNLLRTHRVELVGIARVSTRVKWGGHMGCIELSDGRELMMHGLGQANPFTSRKPLALLKEALDVIDRAATEARPES